MSRKTFSTSIAVVAILGLMALVTLYMALDRVKAAIDAREGRTRPRAQAPASAPSQSEAERSIADQLAAQGFEGMTLTPAGQAQIEQLGRSPGAPPPGTPARPRAPASEPRKASSGDPASPPKASAPPARGD